MESGSGRNSAIAANKFIGFMQRLIGGIGMFVFSCGIIAGIDEYDALTSTICVVIVVLFFMLWRKGRRRKIISGLFPDYARRLSHDPARSVDNLAASRGEPVVKVRKNVASMLKMGFFPGAYLDGPLLILRDDARRGPAFSQPTGPAPESAGAARTVNCSGCGAIGTVTPGLVTECEFCGSPLGEMR